MNHFRNVTKALSEMIKTSRIMENTKYIQHGTTSVFTHCRNVALVSLVLSDTFKIKVDSDALVRGCLLHDYFLYDWHNREDCPFLHGYVHPKIALKNASEIYDLNETEKDIIKHHMFPLTICPPKTKEGFIVTISDKLCSIYETFKLNERHLLKRKKIVGQK